MAAATNSPVGLIAGAGRFPIAFAAKAKQLGIPVVGVGLKGLVSSDLASLCVQYCEVGIARFAKVQRTFRKAGVSSYVLAGKVMKINLLQPRLALSLIPDWKSVRFWFFRRPTDNKDDSLLLGFIREFERDGFHCASALDYCPELLVRDGILTRRVPTKSEEKDIEFGWSLAREMGRLDVGQSVAVRECAVMAVEAIEGTDRAIARAGELCKGNGFVVVKVAKPQQDMRFDVPTIGMSTIETMHKVGGKVLAIEAGKTILLDETETVRLADKYGICIVALKAA